MRSLLIGAVLWMGLAGACAAQTPGGQDLAARIAAFEARIAALQQSQKAMPPPANLEEALQRRVALDAAIRSGREMAGLSLADRYIVQEGIHPTVRRIETENAAWLKSVLPADGWFRLGREGFRVSAAAWEIVLHSRDVALQKEVVARMEPLLREREVDAMHYANLYDRVLLAETGKQRFGSHAVCRGDKMVIAEMDEPDKVQDRRDAIGIRQMKFADVQALFKDMPCDERSWRRFSSVGAG